MKKLVIGFFAVALLWLLLDRGGGWLMGQVFQHSHDMTSPTIRHLAQDADEDVILMGASRCNGHYVPSILQDSLNMSVFNGGVDGSHDIYAHYLSLCYLLDHHTPKVICLELFDGDFNLEEDPFYTVSYYAPYFGRNVDADSVFALSGKAPLYRISHLYRYNAKALSNLTGLVKDRWQNADHGYVPIPCPPHFPDTLVPQENVDRVDSTKIAYIEKFIHRCRERGIRLVFTISPCYTTADSNHYQTIRNISEKYEVPLLDYHTSGLFQDNPANFHDELHLWDSTARVFTSLFAKDLKDNL